MIAHLPIDPIAISPRTALIHDTLCHIPYPGERHCNIPSSLFGFRMSMSVNYLLGEKNGGGI